MSIADKLIANTERSTGEELDYMREIARLSPGGFWKFGLMAPLLKHRGQAPADLWHLARLGAIQQEDCGPCLQTVVNAARAAGIPRATLQAALDGADALTATQRDAYRFGRLVAGDEVLDSALLERLEGRIGRAALVDLALAAAAVRIFPAVKRGLGYARSCSRVEIDL